MKTVSLAAAKARLSELVAEAEAGGEVLIARRGKPVARLVPVEPVVGPYDWAEHMEWLEAQPLQPVGAGEFVRQMRDSDRY